MVATRASNRLVAQRARAKAKAETEYLRSEVTILTAQLDILKNALSRSVSETVLATIFANCEELRTRHVMQNVEETQDDEDDGDTISRSSSSPKVNSNTNIRSSAPILLSHPHVPPPTTKYQAIPPLTKQAEPVVATSSAIPHQQHQLTSQQIQQLHHMQLLQHMVELQQQHVNAYQPQPQPQPSTTLYHNNFGQFPFISYNLAAAAAAASQATSTSDTAGVIAKSHTHPSSLSLLQLPSQPTSMCSSSCSERSYSSTSSSHTSSSAATDFSITTDKDTAVALTHQNHTHRGDNDETDSPRSVEDDAEMVFTALTHMRSEILKNSTKDQQ